MPQPNIIARVMAFLGRPASPPVNPSLIKERHRARCNDFRLLIRANNKALEGMSEIEEALHGTMPFGMAFIRSRCVQVASSVRQMVQRINALSDNSYPDLEERFHAINNAVAATLEPRVRDTSGPLALPLAGLTQEHAGEVGPKALNLSLAAANLQLAIPEGFVVTASGFRLFMEHSGLRDEIRRLTQIADTGDLEGLAALSHRLQEQIQQSPLPPQLQDAIEDACSELRRRMGSHRTLAVRSSALGEDLAGMTAAGQYRTVLNVRFNDVIDAYRQVVAGKYDVPALAYRFNRGLRDEDIDMCVACMVMVDAAAGGVAYSRDPADIASPDIIINAVDGAPVAVVDGSRDADLIIMRRSGSGFEITSNTAKLTGNLLTQEHLATLARHVDGLEQHFGSPQDVEWALDRSGSLILLQSRPLHADAPTDPLPDHNDDATPPLMQGGITAASGIAHGPVQILRNSEDAYGCPHGAVAVMVQSLPRWAPVMNRVAGLVAERGSATGHLASVAREFGIPALFGLEGAVAALENVADITVDADYKRIYAGCASHLLADRPCKPRNLMQGSPVHTTLRNAAEHIVPLHLLDPAAEEFRPVNCNTFHDITRFCHEKAVEELFRVDDRFPRDTLSRQLYVDRPMQYRVVDLDDGLEPDLDARFVQIKDIRSVPMLALWEGMTAVPLEAPVALDTRGFMSVLVQAASNPELDPAAHTQFTQQNYFMISSTFCNLQARFGFHFSTAEAQITDTPQENYATLRFKGGAADLDRRLRRVRLLGELLEERGFRVDVVEDALFARIEGLYAHETEEGAALLGFLIMHSRQLDMVMSDAGRATEWRKRLYQGMETVIEAVRNRRAERAAAAQADAEDASHGSAAGNTDTTAEDRT